MSATVPARQARPAKRGHPSWPSQWSGSISSIPPPPPSPSRPATERRWRWPRTPTGTASTPCRPRNTTEPPTPGCPPLRLRRIGLRRHEPDRGHGLGDHRSAVRPAAARGGHRGPRSAERGPAGDGRRHRIPARGVRTGGRRVGQARPAPGRAAGDPVAGVDRRTVPVPRPHGPGHPRPCTQPHPLLLVGAARGRRRGGRPGWGCRSSRARICPNWRRTTTSSARSTARRGSA